MSAPQDSRAQRRSRLPDRPDGPGISSHSDTESALLQGVLTRCTLAYLVLTLIAAPASSQSTSTSSSHPGEEYIADVPGMEWGGLDETERERATRIMNAQECPCSCGMSIAQCRRDDRNCAHSAELAAAILAGVKADKADGEIVRSLSPASPAVEDETTIARVRLDIEHAPSVGPRDAPVTLVELIDYQCPFCARVDDTIEGLMKKYGDKLRWVVLQNPLDFHPQARRAAEAALAAAEQGKFQAMHSLLLKNQDRLGREDLVAYAGQLGLAEDAFAQALDSRRYRDRVTAHRTLAARIGAGSTPFFFINGRPIRGAQPFSAFEQVIEEELSGRLRPARWVDRLPDPPVRTAETPTTRRPPEDPDRIYAFELAGSAARGPEDAPITLVEFTDFQCSFCADIQKTLDDLGSAYAGKIRWVALHRPLTRIHDRALPSALAALAAARQGKYWEYRERLFANQKALSDEDLLGYAKQMGLDMERFEDDRKDPELLELLKREVEQANEAGARGTPTLFINGKRFAGMQSLAVLKSAIESLLAGSEETVR